MSRRVVGIVGTMDTKGAEFAFVKERIEALGLGTLVVNAGIAGEPRLAPDIDAATVAEAGGTTLAALRDEGDRGSSVAAMAEGAAVVASKLHADGRIHGVISLGGSAGTTIGTAAMRALPVGTPKLMVSTLAAGDVGPYVGTRDIAMMYSVVDVAGVNRVSRLVFSNAANAIAGMVNGDAAPAGGWGGDLGTRDASRPGLQTLSYPRHSQPPAATRRRVPLHRGRPHIHRGPSREASGGRPAGRPQPIARPLRKHRKAQKNTMII